MSEIGGVIDGGGEEERESEEEEDGEGENGGEELEGECCCRLSGKRCACDVAVVDRGARASKARRDGHFAGGGRIGGKWNFVGRSLLDRMRGEEEGEKGNEKRRF